jgi:mannose-1-phosphate guanylyltransferase / mannose-6-phosphate isomerase
MIIPVILSGGSGTRLWPLSRQLFPKQLIALTGEESLLQQTINRLNGLDGISDPLVICNESHRFMVAEQLREAKLKPEHIILEPIGRNTAPATALASLYVTKKYDDPLILILPADHLIANVESFKEAILAGIENARQNKLVTFGIIPDSPETGYGYIKKGQIIKEKQGLNKINAFYVDSFVEKPDLSTAKQYIESGNYFWNSGMFLFKAGAFLEELKKYEPAMSISCEKAFNDAVEDLDFLRIALKSFQECPDNSIDYAVMEKTENSVVVPIDAGWNDIGSWSSLWEVSDKDEQGNVSKGDVLLQDSKDSYLHATNRLIAAIGLNDHIVVETADAVLVAAKDKVQDVKAIVNKLKNKHRSEAIVHQQVFRPWGSYRTIFLSERFQVKLIIVNPNAILSLQKHHHRAEHWIVVKGTARITKGSETFLLSENQSTFIPLGVKHRLENPGVIPLELVEVQSGSYLGEDDIVRLEDDYGRIEE